MSDVKVLSHLHVNDWIESWKDKVVEDTNENKRATQKQNCFWGHFINDSDFVLCFHKEFEVKSFSLRPNFYGHIVKDEKGCVITGHFGRKASVNVFLGIGAILCLMAVIGSVPRQDLTTLISALVLLGVLVLVYILKPKRDREIVINKLQEISFDAKFYGKGRKKKKTMKEKATIDLISDTE